MNSKRATEQRDLQAVNDDLLWPDWSLDQNHLGSKRLRALANVLCRIPANHYKQLAGLVDSFCWFIPPKWNMASIELLPATWESLGLNGAIAKNSRVLYLSPMLEKTSAADTVAVIAHELAHLVLGHNLITKTKDEYDRQEQEADRCIIEWGFDREQRIRQQRKRRQELI